jgi:hypothetical protein
MSRNYTIDYIRLFSAFGVILIHLSPSSLAAEKMTFYFSISAVPFFLFTSLYLFQSKDAIFEKIPFSRILIPYVSWSAIYLTSRTIKHLITHAPQKYDWLSIAFLGGSAVQLYFLPLLLCFLITASAINILFADRDCKVPNKLLALFSITFLIIVSNLLKKSSYLGFQGDFFPKILYYILLSQAVLVLLPHLTKARKSAFFCSTISAFILLLLGANNAANSTFVSALLAGSILIACLMRPTHKVPNIMSNILSTTYGIYLCHHLFIEIIEFSLNKSSVNYLPYSIPSKLTFAFTVISLSIFFVLFIRRWAILAFLLLGEVKVK